MKTCVLISLLTFSIAAAVPPIYGTPSFVQASGVNIDVGYYGAPCMTDWNGDGLKDLILGQYDYGKIRFYPNSGTDAAPVFTTYSFLQAGGVDITLPYG